MLRTQVQSLYQLILCILHNNADPEISYFLTILNNKVKAQIIKAGMYFVSVKKKNRPSQNFSIAVQSLLPVMVSETLVSSKAGHLNKNCTIYYDHFNPFISF